MIIQPVLITPFFLSMQSLTNSLFEIGTCLKNITFYKYVLP